MAPPIWVNEHGQRAQARPCPRPGCGREVPIRQYRYETLRQIVWPLYRVARYGEWCGHWQELIPVPDDAEWVLLVRITALRWPDIYHVLQKAHGLFKRLEEILEDDPNDANLCAPRLLIFRCHSAVFAAIQLAMSGQHWRHGPL